MSDLKIISLEAELTWENPVENRAAFESKIRNIADRGCDIVALPENFTTGFSMNTDRIDSWASGETLSWMQGICAELDVAIFGSVAFKMPDGSSRNRGLFVRPNGQYDVYDKKHLFTLGGENDNYVSGEEKVIVEYKGWKILLQICYDLRFPVFSRNRPEDLYDLILYIANWPKPRIHAWRTLLQARAIENQCYVMGVNRTGVDPSGNIYTGDSLGVDPLGNVLSEGPVVEMDCVRKEVDEFRQKYPFLWDGE